MWAYLHVHQAAQFLLPLLHGPGGAWLIPNPTVQ